MANKTYSMKTALFDLFMIVITGGFWLLFMIARYIRTH